MHRAYKSVQRPVLFFGIGSAAIVTEIVIGIFLSGLITIEVGDYGWTIGAIAVFFMHSFFTWAFNKDPRIMKKFSQFFHEPDALHPGGNRNLPPGFGGII